MHMERVGDLEGHEEAKYLYYSRKNGACNLLSD